MAQDVAPIERLEDHPIAVDPHAIEEEFDRIWRETASAGYDESSIRVRVLNLIAVATEESATERFEEAMQVLPQRHPCRGILALASGQQERLSATISAHCWRSEGSRRHVCSEEVLLAGGAGQEAELASAVLGLLVPDLPVAVWVTGAPDVEDGLAGRLLDAADHVLLDSARADDLRDAYGTALRLRSNHDLAYSDLAWGRGSAWRALAAQLFDGAAGARELDLIRSIEVRGGRNATGSEALLFGGWLTSRLGLTLADTSMRGATVEAVLYDGSRGVRLSVGPASDGSVLGSVRLHTPDASFLIERHAASGHLHVSEDWDSGSMHRTVGQQAADDPSIIALALDSAADAPVCEAATTAARALLRGQEEP